MKERRVDYEVSEGARSQSLVDRDKEFALCSQCGGSYCVFCVAKRRGIIDHGGCSGQGMEVSSGRGAQSQKLGGERNRMQNGAKHITA